MQRPACLARVVILTAVLVAFYEKLMPLVQQLGAHHFEALGWNLLRNVLCVSQ